jgi:hypothetical protein
MLKVERKKVNKQPYLVTDYMYEGDNIGINLVTLANTKTSRKTTIPCVPISYSDHAFNSHSSRIEVVSNIGLDINDNLQAVFDIKFPDRNDTKYIEFNDADFAQDIINTCILDKKDIKDLKCYKAAIDTTIEQIKKQSLEENILIKTPILNYKCYVYTEDLVFLGTANRLLENSYFNGQYILGEYCGKKLTDYIDEFEDKTKLVIDVCITEDITLQLKNIELVGATPSTMGYALIDALSARVVRVANTHKSIAYKIPEGFVLPEHKPSYNYNNYYEAFLMDNNPTIIEKFYKLNKVSTNPTIDINRYLIW